MLGGLEFGLLQNSQASHVGLLFFISSTVEERKVSNQTTQSSLDRGLGCLSQGRRKIIIFEVIIIFRRPLPREKKQPWRAAEMLGGLGTPNNIVAVYYYYIIRIRSNPISKA